MRRRGRASRPRTGECPPTRGGRSRTRTGGRRARGDPPRPPALRNLEVEDEPGRSPVFCWISTLSASRRRAVSWSCSSSGTSASLESEWEIPQGSSSVRWRARLSSKRTTRPRVVAPSQRDPAERPRPVRDAADVPELTRRRARSPRSGARPRRAPRARQARHRRCASVRLGHQVARAPRDLEPLLGERARPVGVAQRQGGEARGRRVCPRAATSSPSRRSTGRLASP